MVGKEIGKEDEGEGEGEDDKKVKNDRPEGGESEGLEGGDSAVGGDVPVGRENVSDGDDGVGE